MKDKTHILIAALLLLALASCGLERPPQMEACAQPAPIWPDYAGVTIPAEIAPMNFNIVGIDGFERMHVAATGNMGGKLEAGGEWADFDIAEWHKLLAANRGGAIKFDVSVKTTDGSWRRYQPFEMLVSEHPLADYGITYRKIAPGFETFSKIGIYQRSLSTFEETPILEETAVDGQCLNCHFANRCNPEQFSLHVRGAHGGTFIKRGDKIDYYNTSTPETSASCTYGYWHPDGRYCAYSLNRIYQNFYVGTRQLIEPWDAVSDVAVLDLDSNELIVSPLLSTPDCQTTPAFSADGSTLYFCYAPKANMPGDYDKLRYSLCSIPFDAATGKFGEKIDTIISADSIGMSVSLPRPSYDGKRLVYCVTPYGTTPVNRPEADLWMLDLATGECRPLDELNSDDTDAYHNWSSDSRWMLFGSRRGDGLYSKVYITCVGDDGVATKPFLLPQRNPLKYHKEALHAFNVPDFTSKPVELDPREAHSMAMASPEGNSTVTAKVQADE